MAPLNLPRETLPLKIVRIALQPIEVTLSTYRTVVFMAGFCVFTGLWIGGELAEWYEFATLVSALVLGLFVSQIRYLKFFGVEFATNDRIAALQDEILRHQLFQDVNPQPSPANATSNGQA